MNAEVSSCPRTFRNEPRRRFTVEYKRQVVRALLASPMSLARVARDYDLNHNQLARGRHEYERGKYGEPAQSADGATSFLCSGLVVGRDRNENPSQSGTQALWSNYRTVAYSSLESTSIPVVTAIAGFCDNSVRSYEYYRRLVRSSCFNAPQNLAARMKDQFDERPLIALEKMHSALSAHT